MISFDVKLIFTIVPLDRIVDIILRRTFDNQEIQTTLRKKELKELLILCTKNIYFNFGGKTFFKCGQGFTVRSSVSWYFDGIPRKYVSSNLNWIHEVLEKVCGWYYLLCENLICHVYSFNSKQF